MCDCVLRTNFDPKSASAVYKCRLAAFSHVYVEERPPLFFSFFWFFLYMIVFLGTHFDSENASAAWPLTYVSEGHHSEFSSD